MSEVPLHWAVTSTAAEVYKKDLEAAQRLADATTRLSKSIGDGSAASKKQAAAVLGAAESIRKERQIAEATVKVAREWGVSHRTASQIARKFKGDVDALSAVLRKEAVALDRAQKEMQELARAQRAASSSGRSHLVSVRNLHQAYALLAGAAGIRAATSAVLDWIQKAERQERALFQVEARLKSTGNAIGFTTGELAAMASEIQRATGIGDEALLEQAGVILSFTEITKNNFRGTLEAALDMAAALGKDVPSQVLALSKALSDGKEGLTQLKRSGTIFRGELKEQIVALFDAGKAGEAQALILKEVNRQYGGAAKAAREHGGTTAALKTEVEDLEEALGELILGPGGLREFIEVTTGAVRSATEMLKGTGELSGVLKVLWDQLMRVNAAVNPLVTSVNAWRGATDLVSRSLESLGLQTVQFETWVDKQNEALRGAIVQHERYQEVVKKTATWEEKMASAVTKAAKAIEEAERKRQEDIKKGEALTNSLRTAQQKLDDEMAEAERLYRAGAISLDTLTEARRRYNEESQKLRTEEFVELRDRIKEAKDQLAELAAYEEVDIRVRLDLDNLNAQLSEAIATSLSGDDLLKIEGIEAGFFADVPALVESYDGIRKSTEEQLRQLDVLTGSFDLIAFAFQDIDSSLGQLITRLAKVAGNISSSIGDIQAGGAQGGAMGALSVVGGVIGIFSQVYSLAQGMLADARAKRFGVPLTAGVSGGRFSGQAIGTGAVSQSEATATVAAWRDAIEQFRIAVGGFLVDLPEISTRVRNDGKEVELSVGGVVYGIFASLEEAFEAGLRIAVGQANIEGIGPTVAEALKRVTASSMDELLKLLPTLRELDDVAEGLTASYSRARTASESWRTELDIEAEALLNHGAALADVVAWRQREIEAQRELLRASGNALAGVSTSFGRLQEWMDSVKAFNEAQGQEAARLDQLTKYAEGLVRDEPRGLGGASGGGGGLGEGGGTGPTNTGGATPGDAGDPMGRIANSAALREQSEATKKATKASRELTDSYVEQIRASVRMQAQASLFGELADFEEAYGIKLSGGLDMRRQIAELEFRAAQIRIALLVEELAANAQLLGITDAQIAQYRQWAQEVGAADFTGVKISGGAGGSARKQRQEELQRATEEWNRELERLSALQAGATEDELSRAAALAELAAKGREAKMGTEEIAQALSMLAELQLREITQSREAATAALGRTDFKNAFLELQERARADLAEALVSAADNPEAYRAARDAIRAGLAAELRELGRGALSGGRFGLRQSAIEAARTIRFLVSHLEELGLTANQVARNVQDQIVPQLLDIVQAEAQRTGDVDAYNLALAQEAELRKALTKIELEGLELQLRAANALTPALQEVFDTARRLLDMPTAPAGDGGGQTTDLAYLKTQYPRQAGETDAQWNARLMKIMNDFHATRPKPTGGGGTGPSTESQGQSTADIIRRLQRNAASELERLEMDFADLFREIAESTGTAAEKAQALALAEEELARLRQELTDRQLSDLYDLAARLEQELLSRSAPKAQIEAAQAAFQAAAASLDPANEDSVRAFREAADAYLTAAASYSDLVGSGVILRTAQEAVLAILAQYGITGAGPAAAAPTFAGQPPPGAFAPFSTFGGSIPPSPPSPIVIASPAGGGGPDVAALAAEVATLRREVQTFHADVKSNAALWVPARRAIETGAIAVNR